jgi:hypothetical protein
MRLDGVDDRIRFVTLAPVLANVSDTAWTVASVFRRATLAQWDGVTYMLDAAGTEEEAGFSVDDTNTIRCDGLRGGSADFNPGLITSTTNAYATVVSKATGTVPPRRGLQDLGANTSMLHVAGNTAIADGNPASMLAMGAWEGSDLFDGWLGLVGWWQGDMTDADKELLTANRRTSDWWNHPFGQPKFLCELNISTPFDIAGNATGYTAFGGVGTIDNNETLGGWRMDGKGDEYTIPQNSNPDYSTFPRPLLRRRAA